MNNDLTFCSLCPRKCNVNRENESGFCGEKNLLKIATACLHFGEETVITCFGGSGTIFFTGCTLRCSFCQNYQISQKQMGATVDSEKFVKMCLLLQSKGAENINLVTPSHFTNILSDYIKKAQDSGVIIPFCWNSSAYESIEALEKLKNLVTIFLPDLKTLDTNLSNKLFKASDYPERAKDAILWMVENNPIKIETKVDVDKETGLECTKEKLLTGVIIRHLFLPGKLEQTVEVLQWLKENIDNKAFISLMSQYTPVNFSEEKNELLNRQKSLSILDNRIVSCEEDNDFRDLIDIYEFENLFYQDLVQDTQWLPDFNQIQPFSNKLATPVWHWSKGFLD